MPQGKEEAVQSKGKVGWIKRSFIQTVPSKHQPSDIFVVITHGELTMIELIEKALTSYRKCFDNRGAGLLLIFIQLKCVETKK